MKTEDSINDKLQEQISKLGEDIADNFVTIGESLSFMRDKELSKEEGDFKALLRSANIDPPTAYRLIRIYDFFGPYSKCTKTIYLLKDAGWTKILEIVDNKEKFQEALDINFLNYNDLTLLAIKKTKSEIEDFLENESPPQIWEKTLSETNLALFNNSYGSSNKALKTIISKIMGYIEGFTNENQGFEPFYYNREKFHSFSNSTLRRAIVHSRNVLDGLFFLADLKNKGLSENHYRFIHGNKPPSLAEKEDAAIKAQFTLKDSSQLESNNIMVRKMLNRGFLGLEDISELTDIQESKLMNWMNSGYFNSKSVIYGERTDQSKGLSERKLYSLVAVRKANVIKEKLEMGLELENAIEKAEKVVRKENKFKILIPYYSLEEKVTTQMREQYRL